MLKMKNEPFMYMKIKWRVTKCPLFDPAFLTKTSGFHDYRGEFGISLKRRQLMQHFVTSCETK